MYMGVKLSCYRAWIRDVFWLGPPGRHLFSKTHLESDGAILIYSDDVLGVYFFKGTNLILNKQ